MGIEKIKGEKKRKKKEEILSEKSLIILWPICMKCTSKVKLSLMVEEKNLLERVIFVMTSDIFRSSMEHFFLLLKHSCWSNYRHRLLHRKYQ